LTQKCGSGNQSACNELLKIAVGDRDTWDREAAMSLLPIRVLSANRVAVAKIAANKSDPVHGMAALKLNEVLLEAATRGDGTAVRSLLDLGADPNAHSTDAGALNITALMFAASKGHRDVAEVLLEKGANVNAVARGRDYVVMPNGATTIPGWTLRQQRLQPESLAAASGIPTLRRL
jgi:ankyrin repeat protein